MGKVEDMRRLREQRAAAVRAPAAAPARSTQAPPPARTAAAPVPDASPDEGLCGHTSISGRSCTREKDHQKAGTKNHRYG